MVTLQLRPRLPLAEAPALPNGLNVVARVGVARLAVSLAASAPTPTTGTLSASKGLLPWLSDEDAETKLGCYQLTMHLCS